MRPFALLKYNSVQIFGVLAYKPWKKPGRFANVDTNSL